MLKPADVPEYFKLFPDATQNAMEKVRTAIYEVVPQAVESISYGMPTYKYLELLAHFAAYERHIGFYPGSKAIAVFADDIKQFKSAKGSVQFPLDKPMPVDIIKRIIRFRLDENLKNPKN